MISTYKTYNNSTLDKKTQEQQTLNQVVEIKRSEERDIKDREYLLLKNRDSIYSDERLK